MTWKQIKQPEDPDWVEWHSIVDVKVTILKVWQRMDGLFQASIDSGGLRGTKVLEATTIESAKIEAEHWARGE